MGAWGNLILTLSCLKSSIILTIANVNVRVSSFHVQAKEFVALLFDIYCGSMFFQNGSTMKDLMPNSLCANTSMPTFTSTIYSCHTKLIFLIAQILENSASKLKFDTSL